jgi:hypothetical protein
MSVKGRFGVEVLFTDSTVADGAKSLKTIAISHATEYDFGKVAVVAGTVGTAAVVLPVVPTTYKNASGDVVSFASVSRIAFSATGSLPVRLMAQESSVQIDSRASQVAVSELTYQPNETAADEAFEIAVRGTAGTSAYTLVMYGS